MDVPSVEVDFSNANLHDDELVELVHQILADGPTALLLASNHLTQLPASIGSLSSLQVLRLGGNQLTSLPSTIAQLCSLETLGLNCNQLQELPEAIGELCSLQSLRLHGNRLLKLPESIGRLRTLRSLALGGNQLESLPESLGNLRSLEILALNSNRLSVLPTKALGGLSSLRAFAVEGNDLSALPGSISRLSSLTSLNASGNRLEALPDELSGCAALTTLNVSSNLLTALPGGMSALGALQYLNLSFNTLSALPTGFERLPCLRTVWLVGNPFSPAPLLTSLPACRTLWLDAASSFTPFPKMKVSRTIVGTSDRTFHYQNFLQLTDASGSTPASTLVIAFGIAGFDFGGVIKRAGLPIDILFVYDSYHTSYLRRGDALRDFLLRTRSSYHRVGAIGSSQSAFGALHYLDCVDSVFAISPLDSFAQSHRHVSSTSDWLPRTLRPIEVTIHVAEDNFLDMTYADFCQSALSCDGSSQTLRLIRHPGAGHPAYPGDDVVHDWLRSLVAAVRLAAPEE